MSTVLVKLETFQPLMSSLKLSMLLMCWFPVPR
jgi:hypothetical protein